jgi:hypothetical protein
MLALTSLALVSSFTVKLTAVPELFVDRALVASTVVSELESELKLVLRVP